MTLILRNNLPRPLTHDELDSNFLYLNIIPWEKKSYLEGQFVIHTSGGKTLLYYCNKGHTDFVYTQNNNNFTETYTQNGQTTRIWTRIGDASGGGGTGGAVTGGTLNESNQLILDSSDGTSVTIDLAQLKDVYNAVSLTTDSEGIAYTGGTGNPADVYAGKDSNTFKFRGIKALNDNITVTYDDHFIYIGGKTIEPVGSNITVVNNNCNGESAGSITIYVTGGTQSYRFSIDNGVNWTPYTQSNTQVYTDLVAGNYNVRVEDETIGGIVNTVVVVTEPDPITFSANVTNVTVVGQTNGSIQITASGGNNDYLYSFDGGANFSSSNTLNNASETSYVIVVKDTNNCVSDPQTILVGHDNERITITSVTHTDPVCPGGTGTITISAANGSGLYQFSLDGINFFPTTAPFTSNFRTFSSGVIAGTYSNITVKDYSTNDTVIHNASVVVNDPIGITLQDKIETDALCGGNATVYIEVVGANGQAQISLNGVTYTNMTLISFGRYQYTYTFSVAGNHSGTIYYKDTCNQVGTTTYNVNKYNAVSASVSSVSEPECAGDDWSYQFSVSGGLGEYEYSFDFATWLPYTDGDTITVTSSASETASTQIIHFKDAENNSCRTSLNVNNSKVKPLKITLVSSTNPLCSTGTGTISVSASGGRVDIDNDYEYALIINGVEEPYDANRTFTGLASGFYNVNARVAGTKCTPAKLSANVEIVIPRAVTASIASSTNPTTCAGNDGTITVNVSGGSGSYFYSTNNGSTYNGSAVTPTGGQIVIGSLAAGSYTVVIKDSNNCVMTGSGLSRTLAAPTGPSLSGTYTAPLCNGGNATITLTATGGASPYTYSSNGSSYQSSNIFTRLAYTGNQTYYVKDANNCVTTASVTGTGQPSALSLSATRTNETTPGANDGTITPTFAGGTSPYTLRIQDSTNVDISGSPFSSATSGTVYSNLEPDTYKITLTDTNACTASINITVSAGVQSDILYYFRASMDGGAYPPNNYIEITGSQPLSAYDLATPGSEFVDAATNLVPATLNEVLADYVSNLSAFNGGSINLTTSAPSGFDPGNPITLSYGTVSWDSGLHILVPNTATYKLLTTGTRLTDAANIPFNAYSLANVTVNGRSYRLYGVYSIVKLGGSSTTITIK